ncbi:MAG: hypothetical protein IPJ47_12295 [Anaerolineales bacterium]|nr:hypothetical protein [Anaerolineales bacterium]
MKPNTDHLLVCSADIPALRGSMVDWLVKTAMQTEDDLYYGECPKEVMEARYPESKRTYTKLKDIELCGEISTSPVSVSSKNIWMFGKPSSATVKVPCASWYYRL